MQPTKAIMEIIDQRKTADVFHQRQIMYRTQENDQCLPVSTALIDLHRMFRVDQDQ
ncbi:MAG: hypothetical protein OXD33_10785 [Rhodobacteraceae bacterium]|nr:hypothetical protein [Paracoccaceae bacterium]